MIIEDTGLGCNRTKKLVIFSVTSKSRPEEKKQKFYSLLAERLESECGIASTDSIVSIVENDNADWSLGPNFQPVNLVKTHLDNDFVLFKKLPIL